MPERKPPNNYFYVRVYTDTGAKLELFRDKKQPSTHAQIVDGLKRAIELIEKLDDAAPARQEPPA